MLFQANRTRDTNSAYLPMNQPRNGGRGEASALAERCRAATEVRLRSRPEAGQGQAAKAPAPDTRRTTFVVEEWKEPPPISDEQAECDAIFSREKFGFVLYRTAELPSVLDDYLLQECHSPATSEKLIKDSPFLKNFRLLWKRFLKQSIFGDYRDGEGEFEIMHQAMKGASGRHLAESRTICYQSPFLAPETDDGAAEFRYEHRRRRALPPDGKAYGWERWLHPRYFLVMDKAGFPPVDAVVFNQPRRAARGLDLRRRLGTTLLRLWVTTGFRWVRRAFEGESSKLDIDIVLLLVSKVFTDLNLSQVRFVYNVYIHFWPLTRHEGFDLKKLWMQQREDHSKPYPFPGHDLTEEVVRERVPYGNGSIPWDVWVQFVFAVIMHMLSRIWQFLKALVGL